MSKIKKTEKYYISTYLSDSVVHTSIEVSKREFDKQFQKVLSQYHQQVSDSEFYVDMDTYVREYNTYIEKRVSLSSGISALDFVTVSCKDGYYFK